MRILFSALLMMFGCISQAAYLDMGIVAGYRANDGDSTVTGTSVDGGSGLILGGTAYIPINEMLQFRTGFLLNQRYYTTDTAGSEVDVELMYVDVPLTLMLSFAEFGGAFVGASAGLKAKDDCSPGDCTDVESFILPIQFGGFFKIGPQIGIEIFYEMLSGDIISGIEDPTAVGASVVFTLE